MLLLPLLSLFFVATEGFRPWRPVRSPTKRMADADLFGAYASAAENAGLLTDVLTCGCINTVSDSLAQFTEQVTERRRHRSPNEDNSASAVDPARTARLATFGLFDGAVSHSWFEALDGVVGEGQDGLSLTTLAKSAADALVYTPLWCAWFLVAMAVLEAPNLAAVPACAGGAPRAVRSAWAELYRGNVGFFLPLTGLIYGFVPIGERVLAFGVASLVYTTILSLWNNARERRRQQQQ